MPMFVVVFASAFSVFSKLYVSRSSVVFRVAVFLAQRICAMPKFLAVPRVPTRMLGNAIFPMGLKDFRMHCAELKPQTNQRKCSPGIFHLVPGSPGTQNVTAANGF